MPKMLIDKSGCVYGWNYEMAKHVDLYTEIDASEVAAYQRAFEAQKVRQPKRTLSGPEREALLATGNIHGHYPEADEITVVVPPSGLQMDQAMARRSIPEQLTLAPDDVTPLDGPSTYQDRAPPPPPNPLHAEQPRIPVQAMPPPVQGAPPVAPRSGPPSGPQRVVLRRRPE